MAWKHSSLSFHKLYFPKSFHIHPVLSLKAILGSKQSRHFPILKMRQLRLWIKWFNQIHSGTRGRSQDLTFNFPIPRLLLFPHLMIFLSQGLICKRHYAIRLSIQTLVSDCSVLISAFTYSYLSVKLLNLVFSSIKRIIIIVSPLMGHNVLNEITCEIVS